MHGIYNTYITLKRLKGFLDKQKKEIKKKPNVLYSFLVLETNNQFTNAET